MARRNSARITNSRMSIRKLPITGQTAFRAGEMPRTDKAHTPEALPVLAQYWSKLTIDGL
jgi:hypothetical protein